VPAFVWIASELDAGWAVVAALLIFVPHLIVDDGRVVARVPQRVKHVEGFDVGVASSVDQSFHVLSLWLVPCSWGPRESPGAQVRTLLLIAAMWSRGGAFALERTHALRRMEFSSVNERFHDPRPAAPPSDVAIVAMDGKTFQELDKVRRSPPDPRARDSELRKAGAKVIATTSSSPSARTSSTDNALILAVRAHPHM